MKNKTFTLLLGLLFFLTGQVDAQFDIVHHVKIIVDDGSVDWEIDGMVANFGPDQFESLSGDLVFVTDGITEPTDGDEWSEIGQYGCDSLINGDDIDGNIAFISRGACEFGVKLLNAEQQGARAGIIGNRAPIQFQVGEHTNGLVWMAPGVVGDSVTIPGIFINYEDREVIAGLLADGPISITIDHRYMYDGAVAYQYATPLEQVKALDDIQLAVANWDTLDQYNLTFRCTITDPSGGETVLEATMDTLFAAVNLVTGDGFSGENLIEFDAYTPTELGTYTAVFTAETGDGLHPINDESLSSEFVVSDYTFMMDNDNVVNEDGFSLNLVSYYNTAGVNGYFGMGNYFRLGEGGTAVGASFAIANPSALPGIIYTAKLYNADPDLDGSLDNDASSEVDGNDVPESALVAFGTYTVLGTETPNELITIMFDGPAIMATDGIYLLMVEGDGSAGFEPVAFTTGGGENYPDYSSAFRAGNVFDADGLEVWNSSDPGDGVLPSFPHGGRHPVVRLHMDGFVSVKDPLLTKDQFNIYPTLTDDIVHVALTLDEPSDVAKIQLTDLNGKWLDAKMLQSAQNEVLTFDVGIYPAGTYFVRIETERGVATQSFVKY